MYKLFSDEPKDKVSVLKKQKKMTEDAKTMSYDEWNKAYGSMDEEDTKAFIPGRIFDGKNTYKMFKEFEPTVFDKRIDVEVKKLDGERKAEERLTSEATQKAGYLKTYLQNKSTADRIGKEIQTKYQFDPNEDLDPVSYLTSGMIKEANERIKNKQGIPLVGDEKNEMVCIKGVCSLAANQGIDFAPGFGQYKDGDGVDIDEKGRVIPQYNPYFAQNYGKVGFQKLAAGEKPKKGDMVQYFTGGTPKHMELILENKGSELETFNNYDLYNTYREQPEYSGPEVGRDRRPLRSDNSVDGYDGTAYYRISPEAATAALSKNQDYQIKVKGRDAFASSEDKKALDAATKFLQDNKNTNVLGDDQGLLPDIITGIETGTPKQDLLKSVTPKAKNVKLVERIINNLY